MAAVEDRCPHRFAPLSMGRSSTATASSASITASSSTPPAPARTTRIRPAIFPSRAQVSSYPVVEKHKAIWVWMGDQARRRAKIPDFSVLDNVPEIHATKLDKIMIKANYELVVDNLLDLSHTCYLHEGILGNADTVESEITIEQRRRRRDRRPPRHDAEPPGMWAMQWPDHPARVDKFSSIRWMAPSTLRLFVGVCEIGKPYETGTGYHAIHMLTPESERTTHYFFTAVRFGVKTTDEAQNREIQDKIAKMRRFAFVEQDAPVIEAQQRLSRLAEPLDPIILSIDVGPVRYKRVLERMLAAEG